MKIYNISFYTQQEISDWHKLYDHVEHKRGIVAILAGIIIAAPPCLYMCLADYDKNIPLLLGCLTGCLCAGCMFSLVVWTALEDAFAKYREKIWNEQWMKSDMRKKIYNIYQGHKIMEIKADKNHTESNNNICCQ